MTNDTPKNQKKAVMSDAQADRQERLNAALRANLKKRKQQSRARDEKSSENTGGDATGTD